MRKVKKKSEVNAVKGGMMALRCYERRREEKAMEDKRREIKEERKRKRPTRKQGERIKKREWI